MKISKDYMDKIGLGRIVADSLDKNEIMYKPGKIKKGLKETIQTKMVYIVFVKQELYSLIFYGCIKIMSSI